MNRLGAALAAIIETAVGTSTALQKSRGDLHEATARRLGIKLASRPERGEPLDVPRVRANRAEIRRAMRADENARSLRLDTYSRRLTARKAVEL